MFADDDCTLHTTIHYVPYHDIPYTIHDWLGGLRWRANRQSRNKQLTGS